MITNPYPRGSDRWHKYQRAEIERRRHELDAARAAAQRPIVEELNLEGIPVTEIQELWNERPGGKYARAAMPVLLRWMPKVNDGVGLKGTMARVFEGQPWARPTALHPLIQEYSSWLELPGTIGATKDSLAIVIWSIADETVFDKLVELIGDPRHGASRSMLVTALAKMKNPRAVEVAIRALAEDDLAGQAVIALGKLKARVAISAIASVMARHPEKWVRHECKKVLRKLGHSVPEAPRAVHLIRTPGSLPNGLAEASVNFDAEDLAQTLIAIGACLDRGLGRAEADEIAGVFDLMKPNQFRHFRFPVELGGEASKLWVSIHLGSDERAGEVYFRGEPAVVDALRQRIRGANG